MVIVTDEDAKEDEPLKKPNTRKPKPTPNQNLNPKKPTTPKSNKNKIIKETVTTSEEELEVTKSNTKKSATNLEPKSDLPVIPDAIRFDPSKSLENKPKGLVDSLSGTVTKI